MFVPDGALCCLYRMHRGLFLALIHYIYSELHFYLQEKNCTASVCVYVWLPGNFGDTFGVEDYWDLCSHC